ncbi:MAG TPA: glycoside hydrolase family 140 protein [Opitutaceae bacterium]|nr:glycoside hydrolase family 140 protein [Opitutaceae bacterium]
MKPPPFLVHPSKRFLCKADGSPFFYLADTAWELMHRATLDDVDYYMKARAAQGFTVVQTVAIPEFGGLCVPNPYGHCPLMDDDPTRPDEMYFRHVDMVVQRAEWNGLVVGFLPTWGDKWHKTHELWGSKVIFNPENAFIYGRWIGRRFAERDNIIWILGGDRPVLDENHKAINRAMAAGLREGDGGRHLISFHPAGGFSSGETLHEESWLDFNMAQSGHTGHDYSNHAFIDQDYQRTPAKPCMDAEPCYEDHPVMGKKWTSDASDFFDAYEVRKRAYWAVFAGALGHTYGCHPVWQWWDQTRERVNHVRTPWREAVHLPGARQMAHLRRLMEARPFFQRVPDQSLLLPDTGTRGSHRRATRAADGSYAFIYTPDGQAFDTNLDKLSAPALASGWFNPRNGKFTPAERISRSARVTFTPPEAGFDWVLVLDDPAAGHTDLGRA